MPPILPLPHILRTVVVLLLLLPLCVQAQIADSSIVDPRPSLLIRDTQNQQIPLGMRALKVDVKVVGKVARTTLDMTFFSETDWDLKGELVFPLGEGQTISRFAMDIGGQLREGVVVEKKKGQQVFEKIVRRQVDPGLLEWTKGNNFKAQVFPIPANGTKRIVVAYEQELKSTPEGLVYLLPLRYPDVLKNFDLKVEVFRQKVEPELLENELTNLKFQSWEENYTAEMHETDYVALTQLGFTIPPRKNKVPILVEKGIDGQQHFFLHLQPDVQQRPKPSVRKITVLWDVSGSAHARIRDREIALLDAYFAHLGNVEVDLVPFSIAEGRPVSGHVVAGNWSALRQSIRQLSYDGATQLGCLDLSRYTADEILLFTDGISNFGAAEIGRGTQRVYCISSGPQAEHAYLRSLAEETGGTYIPLQETSTADGLALLKSQPYRFLGAQVEGATATYPDYSTVVQRDFSLAGILTGEQARIVLEFGVGDQVMERRTVQVNARKHSSNSGMVRRLWAQKKLLALERQASVPEADIIALGKAEGLVTRHTSLIVLERLEDYLEFDIVPPQELQKAFFAQRQKEKEDKENAQKIHNEMVLKYWEARKTWWAKTFSWEKPSAPQPVKKDGDASSYSWEEDDWGGDDWGEDDEGERLNTAEETRTGGSLKAVNVEEMAIALDDEELWDNGDDFGDFDETEDGWGDEEADGEFEVSRKEKGKNKSKGRTDLAAWDPAEPYLDSLRQATPATYYATYLRLREAYATAPSFFLDCADFFQQKEDKQTALRILSNIAEMKLEDYRLFRILGHRLLQLGEADLAIAMFEQVLALRPEEPQSYRDLAHAKAAAGSEQEAVDLLWEVVCQPWDERFPEIELIALEEMNRLLAHSSHKLKTSHLDDRFLENLPVDMRIVLNWDANNCDMDLWVIDPHGEKCYYSNRTTHIGGWMSRDFTGGYGPEEFLLKKAMPGTYKIFVKYYSDSAMELTGATTIQLQMITNYGRKDEKIQEVTRRLKNKKEVLEIGTIEF